MITQNFLILANLGDPLVEGVAWLKAKLNLTQEEMNFVKNNLLEMDSQRDIQLIDEKKPGIDLKKLTIIEEYLQSTNIKDRDKWLIEQLVKDKPKSKGCILS